MPRVWGIPLLKVNPNQNRFPTRRHDPRGGGRETVLQWRNAGYSRRHTPPPKGGRKKCRVGGRTSPAQAKQLRERGGRCEEHPVLRKPGSPALRS